MREIYLHNIEYIMCREGDNMSDFQSFLDKTLTQIDVEDIKEEDTEIYEYNIYREITRHWRSTSSSALLWCSV